MSEKPMTVTEMARMGGIARAKAHSTAEIQAWGRQGGRPEKLDHKARAQLRRLLARGKSQAEFATVLGVSIGTVIRAVARIKSGENKL